MPTHRRSRPTLRCLTDDLGLPLPPLDTDLGELDGPWFDELRRIAPMSPRGQKRILSIAHPLVYRIRVSTQRGATWLNEEHLVVWLCAVHGREDGSDSDAYNWFSRLHSHGHLLPCDDDRLRDRAEAALRLQRELTSELLGLLDRALSRRTDVADDLLGYLPCRMLARENEEIEEIWCALGVLDTSGTRVSERLRDILFGALHSRIPDALSEERHDWPTGNVEWWEIVRLWLR